jgi:hypothetical protein
MNRADVSFWLSIASFATSFVLAVIKWYEIYISGRAKFTAEARLTGAYEIGNIIILLNESNVSATLHTLSWRGVEG